MLNSYFRCLASSLKININTRSQHLTKAEAIERCGKALFLKPGLHNQPLDQYLKAKEQAEDLVICLVELGLLHLDGNRGCRSRCQRRPRHVTPYFPLGYGRCQGFGLSC